MDRRTWLTSIGATGAVVLAGCTGGGVARREALELERPAVGEGECDDVELLDTQFQLYGRLFPVGDAAVAWPVELEGGDTVKISIYWSGDHDRAMSLPDLALVDPADERLLDESGYSSNIHTVTAQRSGTHEIRVHSQYLTENGRWKITVEWYPRSDCA